MVDYEPLPVIVDPHKALEPDAFVLRPDRGPEKANNHIWHWESGDQAATDTAMAGAAVRVSRGHLHPAYPRRVDRDMRLHRRLGCRPRPAHPAHDEPGAARDPDGPRPRLGPARAEHPGQDPRHRRRLRRQGPGLSGLRSGGRRVADRRQAGQVDRGPLREPAGGLVRPRLPHPRRARRDQGRQDHGAQGQDDRRPRLLRRRGRPVEVPGRPVQRDHRLVRLQGRLRRGRRGVHQQAAGRRRLPLLVPGDRGGPCHRADGRHPGPRYRQGPGPAADGELHPAGAVPVQDADGLGVRLGQLRRRPPEGDGHHRLPGAAPRAGREARPWRADGHRHLLVHRDRRGRAVARLRHHRIEDERRVRDPGPPDR